MAPDTKLVLDQINAKILYGPYPITLTQYECLVTQAWWAEMRELHDQAMEQLEKGIRLITEGVGKDG